MRLKFLTAVAVVQVVVAVASTETVWRGCYGQLGVMVRRIPAITSPAHLNTTYI